MAPTERRTELRTYRVEMPCPCGKGMLEHNGHSQMSSARSSTSEPIEHEHYCTGGCKRIKFFKKIYPNIERVPIKRKLSKAAIKRIDRKISADRKRFLKLTGVALDKEICRRNKAIIKILGDYLEEK